MQSVYSPNSVIRHIDQLTAQGLAPHCRRSSRIVSSIRRPAVSNTKRKPSSLPPEGCIELDSHADTIVLGANCVVLSHTGQTCEVMPYSDTYNAITDVPVVTGATLWTSPHDGTSTFLFSTNPCGWVTHYNIRWSIPTSCERTVPPYKITLSHLPHSFSTHQMDLSSHLRQWGLLFIVLPEPQATKNYPYFRT